MNQDEGSNHTIPSIENTRSMDGTEHVATLNTSQAPLTASTEAHNINNSFLSSAAQHRPTDSARDGDPKQQICFDFTKGQCARGMACKFSHDINLIIKVNSQEKGICFDFLKGTCQRGVLCRFSHDLQNIQSTLTSTTTNAPMNPTAINPAAPRRHIGAPICYDFVKGQCTRGAECRYSHDYASILYGPTKPGKDMNVVCVDYTRGRCMRGANCRYRHDNPMMMTAAALAAQQHQGYYNPMMRMMSAASSLSSSPGAHHDVNGIGNQYAALNHALMMQQQQNSSNYNAILEQLQRASLSDANMIHGGQQYSNDDALSSLSMALAQQAAAQYNTTNNNNTRYQPYRPVPTPYMDTMPITENNHQQPAVVAHSSQGEEDQQEEEEAQSLSPTSSTDSQPTTNTAEQQPQHHFQKHQPAPILTKANSLRSSSSSFKQALITCSTTAGHGSGVLPSPHTIEFSSDSPTIQAAWGSSGSTFQAVKSIWETSTTTNDA